MLSMPIRKIISGGQTGVDRAALDVTIDLSIPHGGWCPAGQRAQDGPIDPIYQLPETSSRFMRYSYPLSRENLERHSFAQTINAFAHTTKPMH